MTLQSAFKNNFCELFVFGRITGLNRTYRIAQFDLPPKGAGGVSKSPCGAHRIKLKIGSKSKYPAVQHLKL